MSTNYYFHGREDCACCNREFPPIHIGKSSCGWVFSLHVVPEDGINSLDDWRRLWATPGSYIRDECGDRVAVEKMEQIITQRSHPEGLMRHDIGRYCLGHGEGTWDYIPGDFS